MQKTALVAGAAGFIGSNLCSMLLNKGYRVLGVDNLVTGRRQNLLLPISQGLEFIERDINGTLLFDGPIDEIYNMASPASPSDFEKMPVTILKTASHGHKNLLELARQTGARVLFSSSSEVYGDAKVHPQVESYWGNVNCFGPRACYDEAKRFGEALNYAYHSEYGVEIRTARIFNTYGPGMRPNDGRIIPNFFWQALQGEPLTIHGEGSQTRSFCFVSDLIEGLHRLMLSNEELPVNIGNPIERTVVEVAQLINTLTENPAPLRFLPLPKDDPKLRRPDIRRAQHSLGWTPVIDLDTGLRLSMAYFKSELKKVPVSFLSTGATFLSGTGH